MTRYAEWQGVESAFNGGAPVECRGMVSRALSGRRPTAPSSGYQPTASPPPYMPASDRNRFEEALTPLPPEVQARVRELAAAARPRPWVESLEREVVVRLPVEELDVAVFDFIHRNISGSPSKKRALLSLPRGVQVFYLSLLVESETLNGGLNQFFRNTTVQYGELIPAALRELGAAARGGDLRTSSGARYG
jgi:hypothetical protein